jgi:uncharacterized coiled-coil DUF342 family protein
MRRHTARREVAHKSHNKNSECVENSSGTQTSTAAGDVRSVESALQALWERVRRAGELIRQLREERRALLTQVEQLRTEVQHLQIELAHKDQLLGSIPAAANSNAGKVFANGEREALAQKVKDLLARIDAYL